MKVREIMVTELVTLHVDEESGQNPPSSHFGGRSLGGNYQSA